MKINEFTIYTNKDFFNQNLVIISDIHISENTKNDKLMEIINTLHETKPNLILIPGDLYNADCLDVNITRVKTYDFLRALSQNSKTFISLGKHELEPLLNRKINETDIYEKKAAYTALLLMNTIQKIETSPKTYKIHNPIHFVGQFTKNNTITEKNFSITGLNFDYDHYHNKHDLNSSLQKYYNYITEQTTKLDNTKFNILLCHDPIIIEAYKKIEELKKYDLIISSHNHGNLASQIYNYLLKKHNKLNAKYPHGLIIKDDTSFIISEGVTKFHSAEGFLERFENKNESKIELIKIKKKN